MTGFATVVHRIHPSNLAYLKNSMDELDEATRVAREAGHTAEAEIMQIAWSALHFAHDQLDRAFKNRRFVSIKRRSLRIGRVHSLTLSMGARCRGGRCRSILWIQLWGKSVGMPVSRWTR